MAIISERPASFEVKNIAFSYIDHDHSKASRELISKFAASDYFIIKDEFESKSIANTEMKKGTVDVILEIPNQFERKLQKENTKK